MRVLVLIPLLVTPVFGAGLDLPMPASAERVESIRDPEALYALSTGPALPGTRTHSVEITGERTRSAWQMPRAGVPLAALIDDLTEALETAGFEIVFTCGTETCGGFDFRLIQPTLPMPSMYVDLGGYSYVAAVRTGEEGPEAATGILFSQSEKTLFAQVTEVTALSAPPEVPETRPLTETTSALDRPIPETGLVAASEGSGPLANLVEHGRMVLGGLAFETGSSAVSETDPTQIAALAAYLKADPKRRVALVGHSDWEGSQSVNARLSRARAASVGRLLQNTYGVRESQLAVEGMGYLSPVVSNDDAEGRQQNRRVEAVRLQPLP